MPRYNDRQDANKIIANYLSKKDRVPHNNEAEKAVMGCMLSYPETIDTVLGSISSESFYNPLFKIMYRCISELRNEGVNVDFVTVKNKMLQNNVEEDRIGNEFFVDLADNAATSANVKDYCDIVNDKFLLRRLILICDETVVACRKDEDNVDAILENAEREIFQLQKKDGQREFLTLRQVWPELLLKITAAIESKDGITGVPTGFRDLDNITAGFQQANFIVIAARPGMGKTSLSLSMAMNMAFKKNIKVAFFSLEMNAAELAMRVLASESKITTEKMRSGRLKEEDTDLINATMERVVSDNLIIDETSYLTIAALRNKCRKLQSERGLDIIMVDYLQLMHAGLDGYQTNSKFINNRQEEVAEISRSLKALAKELNIPVIAMAQVKRPDDKNPPDLADLRESGAIEQDADIVMFIHKDDRTKKGKNVEEETNVDYDDDSVKLYIRKHRNGRVGDIKLKFDKSTTKYYDYDYQDVPYNQ